MMSGLNKNTDLHELSTDLHIWPEVLILEKEIKCLT